VGNYFRSALPMKVDISYDPIKIDDDVRYGEEARNRVITSTSLVIVYFVLQQRKEIRRRVGVRKWARAGVSMDAGTLA
jgi:hypothetical protein